jgi:hypothetical protein
MIGVAFLLLGLFAPPEAWPDLEPLPLRVCWSAFTPVGVAVIAFTACWRWRRRFSRWRNRRRRILAAWRSDSPGTFLAAFKHRLKPRTECARRRSRRRRYDYYRFYSRMTRNL